MAGLSKNKANSVKPVETGVELRLSLAKIIKELICLLFKFG